MCLEVSIIGFHSIFYDSLDNIIIFHCSSFSWTRTEILNTMVYFEHDNQLKAFALNHDLFVIHALHHSYFPMQMTIVTINIKTIVRCLDTSLQPGNSLICNVLFNTFKQLVLLRVAPLYVNSTQGHIYLQLLQSISISIINLWL